MIQTEISDGRGGVEKLDHNDPRYWQGPYVKIEYPKTLFRASAGSGYQNPEQKVVQNQYEHERLDSGWKESPPEARAYLDKLDADVALEASKRLTTDQKMSEPAQREALVADRATDDMLPSIPEKPKRKYTKKIVS